MDLTASSWAQKPQHGGGSAPLRLLEKRREVQTVHTAQTAQRGDFQVAMENLARQWEELHLQEAELQQQHQNFQHFIMEEQQKSQREARRAQKEQQRRQLHMEELQRLQEEREELEQLRGRSQLQIQRYAHFPHYLQRVLRADPEFQEPADILDRYHTLSAARTFIQQGALEAQETMERARGKISQQLEEANDGLVHHNNQLEALQTALEETQSQRLQAESCWAHILNTAAKKTLLLGKIKMATLNLFQNMDHGTNGTQILSVAMEDTETQLEKIRRYALQKAEIFSGVSRRCATSPPHPPK